MVQASRKACLLHQTRIGLDDLMEDMMPTMCPISALRLADTAKLFDGPWGWGVVHQIKDGVVSIQRVYGCTANFVYSGGVIPYIGTETCTFNILEQMSLEVWDRKELR